MSLRAKRSNPQSLGDCHVAGAPRNDNQKSGFPRSSSFLPSFSALSAFSALKAFLQILVFAFGAIHDIRYFMRWT